jgi:hypothetical protein
MTTRDKNQIFIYNDQEMSLIKAVFCENEDLLYAIRKVLLQFPLTVSELASLRSSVTPEVVAVLKKRINPEMTGDEPWSQLSDMYQAVNNDLLSKTEEDMKPIFEATQLMIDYLNQQFQVLEGKDVEEKIKLNDWKDLTSPKAYVHTKARNFLLGHVDGKLVMIKNIAGEKQESVDEAKKRMDRNSSK